MTRSVTEAENDLIADYVMSREPLPRYEVNHSS